MLVSDLLGAGVFGDSLGSFGDGVFGQLSGEQESHGSLDFPTGDGASLVVVGKARRFGSDSLKDIVDEGVHDRHGFAGNASVGVNLLQDFVDVNSEGLLPALLPLLFVTGTDSLLGFTGLLDGFTRCLGRHDAQLSISNSEVMKISLFWLIYMSSAASSLPSNGIWQRALLTSVK